MNDLTLACLKALYEKRWVLLLVAVVALVFSVLRLLLFTPGSFYAEAILVASTPKLGAEVKDFMPEAYNPKVYVDLVNSRTVIFETYQTVVEKNIFPEDMLPDFDDFADRCRATVSVVDQTTRPINYSPLITLRVWGIVPERAQAVVDIWAEKAMKAAQTANLMQYGELSQTLQKQAEARKKGLDDLWQALEKEKAEFDVTSKKEELGLLLKEMDGLLQARAVSERMAAAAEAQLAAIQQELAGEKPIIELFRSPSDDAYWLLEPSPQKEEKKAAVNGKGMVTQIVNEVHLKLQESANKAAADLAGAQAEIQKIQTQVDGVTERQKNLMAEIARHEYAQQRLTVEEELASSIYKNISTAHNLLAETAGVVNVADGTTYPVGLNRLSNLSPVKNDLAVKGKLIVLSYTFLAVVLAMGAITGPILASRLREQFTK